MQHSNFRTELFVADFPNKISHSSSIISIGSCFADNISKKLAYYKFPIHSQPYGILYNPLIIADNLNRTLQGFSNFAEYSVSQNSLWHSLLHHGSFSNVDKGLLLQNILHSEEKLKKDLKSADLLILSLGTSYTYFYKKGDFAVANCHKIPAAEFNRKLISYEEVYENMEQLFKALFQFNPKLNILLSVSPIRHLKDGFHQNQVSKANLLLAANKLSAAFSQVFYFPAYEIMLDDLRDYRFYAEDFTHPNKLAVDYIWQKFANAFIADKSRTLFKEIEAIQKGLEHKPLVSNPENAHVLAVKLLQKIEAINKKEASLNFEAEKEILTQRLIKP